MWKKFIAFLYRNFEYAFVIILAFPPLLWFRDGYVLLGHDAGFRLDYLSQLPNVFYSWNSTYNFGIDWSMFKGFLVTQFPEVTFSVLTGSFAVGEKLSLIFWFALMGIGMLTLLRSVFPAPTYRLFRLFSSTFYMYNFFILSGWTIGERAKFSLWAALPIGLLLIYNVFVRNHSVIRNGICFGLLYFFLNGGGVLPLYGGTVVVLGLAFVYFTILRFRKDGWSAVWFCSKVISAFVLPFVLLNAYYIVPNVGLLKTSYGSSVAAQGGIDGLIAWERGISQNASFFNVIRLQGLPDWSPGAAQQYIHAFLTNPFLIIFSFIPIVSIILGFAWIRFANSTKEQRLLVIFLILLLPFGLVLTMGTHPPTGILYEFAMKKIPGFVMLRSSFYKFAPAFWFPMIVLSGYFLNQLLLRVKKSPKVYQIIGICAIIGLLAYHYPFFTTDAFTLSDNFSTRVRIPSYLADITTQVKSHVEESSAILVVPKMEMYFPDLPVDTYTWGYFSLDILPRNAINRRFIANDGHNPIVQSLYNALYAGDAEATTYLAGVLRIDYILWRGDARLSVQTQLYDSPDIAKTLLDTNPDFKRIFETESWSLYKIIRQEVEQKIYATTSVAAYRGSDEAAGFLIQDKEVRDTLTLAKIQDTSQLQNMPYQRLFFEAECSMCVKNEFQSLVDSIALPNKRLTPASPLFMFETWRQSQLTKRVANLPNERIDADLALAQNFLSYVNALNRPEYFVQYLSYMNDAMGTWDGFKGRDRNTYAIRLLAYIESHVHALASLQGMSGADAVSQRLDEMTKNLQRNVWMSEGSTYRYMILLDEEGTYELEMNTNPSDVVHISLDGVTHQLGSPARLTSGLHTIEVSLVDEHVWRPYVFLKKSIQRDFGSPPHITFTKLNPTKYIAHVNNSSDRQFLLVFKEQYDPRWTTSITGATHVMVDGFANGWIINTPGVYDVEVYYMPQGYFYIGLVITGGTILIIGIAYGMSIMKRRK